AKVLMFSCSLDVDSGRRRLQILDVPAHADVPALASAYVEHLDRCLRSESAFWQVWSSAPMMFVQNRADADAEEVAPD
ncbi:MAG: hypothetical protein WAU20_01500, partial [Dokdonella sp.]